MLGRIVVFASASRGVGKSFIIETLSSQLREHGSKVLDLDLTFVSESQDLELVLPYVSPRCEYLLIEAENLEQVETIAALELESELVCVVDGNLTGMIATYDIIKVFHQHNPEGAVQVIVNNVQSKKQAEHIFDRLRGAASQFLNLSISYFGSVRKGAKADEDIASIRSELVRLRPEQEVVLDQDVGTAKSESDSTIREEA